MLIMSLLLSAALLFAANLIARKSGRIGVPCLICGVGAFLGVPCLMLPALMLTGIFAALAGVFCRLLGGGPPLFLKCSLASIIASHLLIGIVSWRAVQERMALKERFPTESLAQRLSYETPNYAATSVIAHGQRTGIS